MQLDKKDSHLCKKAGICTEQERKVSRPGLTGASGAAIL